MGSCCTGKSGEKDSRSEASESDDDTNSRQGGASFPWKFIPLASLRRKPPDKSDRTSDKDGVTEGGLKVTVIQPKGATEESEDPDPGEK